MFYLAATLALPPLLVFGLYHLLTWGNLFNLNSRNYWQRVAWTSALSHVLLATGFFIFSYFEYRASSKLGFAEPAFGAFLLNRTEFWRMMLIFDTAPMLTLLGLFAVLNRLGLNPPQLAAWTIGTAYVVGTLQWYWVGGGIGAVLDRFWSGLKTGDEEDEDWF